MGWGVQVRSPAWGGVAWGCEWGGARPGFGRFRRFQGLGFRELKFIGSRGATKPNARAFTWPLYCPYIVLT